MKSLPNLQFRKITNTEAIAFLNQYPTLLRVFLSLLQCRSFLNPFSFKLVFLSLEVPWAGHICILDSSKRNVYIQKVKEHCCLPDYVPGKAASGCSQAHSVLWALTLPFSMWLETMLRVEVTCQELLALAGLRFYSQAASHSSQSSDHVIHAST